jgi:excisionase family DNA binding protein
MALSQSEAGYRPNPFHGYLTTREAATYLHMSYWHFMHLVEANRIPGTRIVDRWLFSPADLDEYRRSTKSGELTELAQTALQIPYTILTPRQQSICEALLTGSRPAEIARQQQQSRQAVHAQIALIREKVLQYLPTNPPTPLHTPLFTPSPLME